MHIAVAGNMGSGKTTLTTLLAEHYGWTPFFEQVDDNPYLDDYYKDIPRWSFNMEVFFLRHRFKDLMRIQDDGVTYIQDRSIYEGVYVFTANNWRMGNLSDRDYQTYMELFELMMSLVKIPDLMIYLRSSVPHLVANIQKRGREYEQAIQLEYLENLNALYDEFIYKQYKGRVLTIDVDNIDYLHNEQDLADILNKIDSLLFGLFPAE
ncbi:MAG: deoxynucleoside kinase [Bacteroidaceae bacterium]|nr:deoxynucleoside kinase [Bacteroidaceae bacterium]MDO4994856.1 deoxynucleoside kinase [Bacteroidales bacterium]